MKTRIYTALIFFCVSVPLWFNIALAVDHNNLDAGRPLEFDDAQSIAYREKALEFGGALVKPRHGKMGVNGSVEYLYGFARNTHFSLDFDPKFASEDGARRRFDSGDIGVGVFHNFNREYGSTPALSLRADAFLPTGRNSRGVDFRLRGIASRQFGARGKLHLNLDAFLNGASENEVRKFQPGAILGYSQLLGYPSRFDRTLLAQLGYRANELKAETGIINVGVGVRQQVSVQSVFDIGVLSDLSGSASRETFKLVAGYSKQF